MRNVRMLVVNVIAKSRGIDYSKGNTNAVLFELCKYMRFTKRRQQELMILTDVSRFDSDPLFNMCRLWAVTNLVRKDVRFAECVYKSRAAGARSACDGQHCYRVQLLLNSLTDDHNSELNALDLVSPPSSDRHFGGAVQSMYGVSYDIDLYLWSGANLSTLLHMNRLSRRDGEEFQWECARTTLAFISSITKQDNSPTTALGNTGSI